MNKSKDFSSFLQDKVSHQRAVEQIGNKFCLEHGIQTLISIREAVVKEKLKGKAPNILSDVVQNNLDSALDITRIQLDSDPSVLSQLKVKSF